MVFRPHLIANQRRWIKSLTVQNTAHNLCTMNAQRMHSGNAEGKVFRTRIGFAIRPTERCRKRRSASIAQRKHRVFLSLNGI